MRVIAIMLVILGIVGLLLSTMMFGEIGLSAAIGSITAILSGIGFFQVNKRLNK